MHERECVCAHCIVRAFATECTECAFCHNAQRCTVPQTCFNVFGCRGLILNGLRMHNWVEHCTEVARSHALALRGWSRSVLPASAAQPSTNTPQQSMRMHVCMMFASALWVWEYIPGLQVALVHRC